MTVEINSRQSIAILDTQKMLESIELLPAQISEVREQFSQFTLPDHYKNFRNVVFLGMGGSTLGSHVIKTMTSTTTPVPLEIINGYNIPPYVNEYTLAVVISYSGTTEEALTTMKKAHAAGAKVVVITSGGEMGEWAKTNAVPAFIFTVKNNPCGSPRMGGGYMLTAQCLILSRLGLLSCSSEDLGTLQKSIADSQKMFGVENQTSNLAKDVARAAQSVSVWYVGAEHLAGSAHIAANQMNENAKRFAGYFLIPELNHHLMEGMKNPVANPENILFVLLESKLYSPKIQKRFNVTKEILAQNKIKFFSLACENSSPFADIGRALSFSSHTSFYTAILSGIDPTAIPFVDFFKAALKK